MNAITSPYIITAALPYTNGPVHIGHLAGVYIPSDIYARYIRQKGQDVVFVCGSDEHGIPITLKAKKKGVTPQEIVDKYHTIIKDSFEKFGISFDNYSRTSSPLHHQVASDFFMDLAQHKVFEEHTEAQFYDEEAQQFLADRYLTGTCPNCGYEDIYRDQCEKCGATLDSPKQLLNIKSTLTGNIPILRETNHWYLPFDQDFLTQWLLTTHSDWKSNVLGQIKSWLNTGLRPRAVTRDLNWGISVPLENAHGKVLYVWFDAPIGYITATQEWALQQGKDWRYYWQNPQTKLIHFIGKDNIVFHCMIFPQMLKSHSEPYILPKNVPANEFLNLENDKISTSNNWAVWLDEYLVDFPNKQDALRYTLTANMPENKDNNFTWKDFQLKNNSELVGILGNFINRIFVLTHKYYGGLVPESNVLTDKDHVVLQTLAQSPNKIGNHLESFHFRDALTTFMDLARLGNQYISEEGNEPWKLIHNDPERVKTILHVCLQLVAGLAHLGEPFIPHASKKLLNMLGCTPINWDDIASKGTILAGHMLNEPSLLFEKIEDQDINTQLNKLNEQRTKQTTIKIPATDDCISSKTTCSFEDFQKIDIRVGTILTATKVQKTDKLLELTVDTGFDVRTIVSGIAESFSPDEILGKQVLILVNLSPRKIRGIESQGMLLLTTKNDNKLCFVTPDETVSNGVILG